MRSRTNRLHAASVVFAAVGLIALSACGGSSEAADDGEIASLETDEETAPDGEDSTDTERSVDEAALDFSQCLRDEGLDVADMGVDADGNIDVRSALQNVEPGSQDFRTAMEACRDILEGVGFGGGRAQLADNTEIADATVEFSECLRDQGFEDIPDLTLGRQGEGAAGAPAPEADSPPEGGQGAREGGFGDRSSQFAGRLDLDPDDPEVIAAMDTCMPIIDQAFSDAGVGQPPGS